jgi:hypothetical protein
MQLAQTMSREDGRAALIHMAQVWLRLAEEQDIWAPPLAVEEPRPVVQQQQQVQPKDDDKKE